VPADESTPLKPLDVYENSKLAAEEVVREGAAAGLPASIVRPVGIYGPGELRFLKLFRAIKNHTFRMIGSGSTVQHLTYVQDVVQGILLCAEQPNAVGQTYIIAGPRYTSLNDLVRATARALGSAPPTGHIPLLPIMMVARLTETICKPLGVEPPLHPRRVAFFVRNRGYCSEKARRELGYSPKVDLEEGLALTAKWYHTIGAL
jgi:nucleoside-diphosphate-sugar epimerase